MPVRARTFRFEEAEYLVVSYPVARERRVEPLTRAERDVVDALLRGATNAEIARARGRSVNTVAKQVASVFRKIGGSSRLELAREL